MDHVQHMGCEEMRVELIESDDDDVDMEPYKMTLVECRESHEGIAYFIARVVYLGDEDLVQSRRLAITSNASNVCCEPQERGN